jgi:hypothetical protein
LLVAVQLPQDLETAYTIACVQEELSAGDLVIVVPNPANTRRNAVVMHSVPRAVDDKKVHEIVKSFDNNRLPEDKLLALKNYRKAKGLCFTCGERWSRDHKCQATVQLHVVQEMVEFLQYGPDTPSESSDSVADMELMQLVSDQAMEVAPERSIVLQCSIQGKAALFLITNYVAAKQVIVRIKNEFLDSSPK